MNVIEMVRFGRTLTDREFGKSMAATILKEGTFPLTLDFNGVMALGSSCGDEVIHAIAPKQNYRVEVKNANQAVMACLKKVVEGTTIKIEVTPPAK